MLPAAPALSLWALVNDAAPLPVPFAEDDAALDRKDAFDLNCDKGFVCLRSRCRSPAPAAVDELVVEPAAAAMSWRLRGLLAGKGKKAVSLLSKRNNGTSRVEFGEGGFEGESPGVGGEPELCPTTIS